MSLQVELLEQSFNYIQPYSNQFVSHFYENLFNAHAETQSLFTTTDPETRNNQFWDNLVLIIENLRQPEMLDDVLQGLGARLSNQGALPEHYPLVRDAFLSTLKQFLGDQWQTEFEQAWQDAYVIFRELMLEGAEHTGTQMAPNNPVDQFEATLDENMVPAAESSVEDFSPTFVTEEETREEEVVLANTDPVLLENFMPTPISESEEIVEEKVATAANTDDSVVEEIGSTPVSKSEATPEQAEEEDVEEETVETPTADSSEKLKSPTIDPHFTQIVSPEAESESAATATRVKSVASETIDKPESQSSKSDNKWLIGGGVVGAIGLLLLLLL